MLQGGRSGPNENHNRLEFVRLLIEAEADPTSIAASYGGAHSSLANALDHCESDLGRSDLYQVRLGVERSAPWCVQLILIRTWSDLCSTESMLI
jgi:hypothetical protein